MTTPVQTKFATDYGGTGAGLTMALDAAMTNGNALTVGLVIANTAVSIVSVKDNLGNDLTLDKSVETNQVGNSNIYFYSRVNVSGAPTGIVVKLTTDESMYVFMDEVVGVPATSYVSDNPAKTTGSTSGAPYAIAGAVTTSNADAFIKSILTLGSGQVVTGSGGFTAYPATSTNKAGVNKYAAATAGSNPVTVNLDGDNGWAVSSIVYKTVAGAASDPAASSSRFTTSRHTFGTRR